MLADGFAVVSKISSKFVHEVLPVALASVIGTLIVNHYGGRPVAPVVVQANPPAGADDFLRTLKDERAVLAAVLKREEESGPTKADAAAALPAVTLAAYDPPAPPPRPSLTKKLSTRAVPKTTADSGKAAPDAKSTADVRSAGGATEAVTARAPYLELPEEARASALVGDLVAGAPDDAASPVATQGAGPIEGVRSFVVNAAQWSAQALPSAPFAVHPLSLFRLPGGGRLF
jgi:hypothetical protein